MTTSNLNPGDLTRRKFLLAGGAALGSLWWTDTTRAEEEPATLTTTAQFRQRAHRSQVQGLQFSADGAHLFSASADGAVRIWQVEDRALAGEIAALPTSVNGLALSPEGKCLAAACSDGRMRVWTHPMDAASASFPVDARPVTSVAFLDDELLLGTSASGLLTLSRLDGSEVYRQTVGTSAVTNLAVTGDDELVTSAADGSLQRRSARTGTLKERHRVHGERILSLCTGGRGATWLASGNGSR